MAVSSELVLYYDPDGTAARAKGVLLRQRIRIKGISPEQAGQPVGFLAGLKGCEPCPGEDSPLPGQPVLVFSGLSSRRLDTVLTALRKAGLSQQVYKAVVTPDNASWSFAALCMELAKERSALAQGTGSPHTNL